LTDKQKSNPGVRLDYCGRMDLEESALPQRGWKRTT
jgi:hypothetical protein